MSEITMSYVLTTFNKLDYLRITLPLLIQACRKDEEIIVVDGGSSDGSSDYLKALFQEQKIKAFLSEKDKGEAHGTNKALLMAKGTLIKIITDDDLFDFRVVQVCKKYMLEHPETDVLGGDGFSAKLGERPKFNTTNFIEGFYQWRKDHAPFLFCGLSLLIRRRSLSYLGLFSTDYKIVDMEYTLRISALNSRIAFCTAPVFINIVNPASNSVKFYGAIRKEFTRLRRTYPEAHLNFKINHPILMMKERLSRLLIKSKQQLPEPTTLLSWYNRVVIEGQNLFERQQSHSTFIIDSQA